MRQIIRIGLDFGPLAVFFIAYKLAGIAAATAALIGCTACSLIATYLWERKIAAMPLISGLIIAIFGGLTLYLQDETFIKIKPTLINLLFAALLLGGLCARRPMLKYVLGHAMQLEEPGWKKLSLRWGVFFIFLALLNEFVWRHFSTDAWVNFKVFGMFSLTMLFSLCQVPLVKKYWVEEK